MTCTSSHRRAIGGCISIRFNNGQLTSFIPTIARCFCFCARSSEADSSTKMQKRRLHYAKPTNCKIPRPPPNAASASNLLTLLTPKSSWGADASLSGPGWQTGHEETRNTPSPRHAFAHRCSRHKINRRRYHPCPLAVGVEVDGPGCWLSYYDYYDCTGKLCCFSSTKSRANYPHSFKVLLGAKGGRQACTAPCTTAKHCSTFVMDCAKQTDI